jgi:hypothetical protein
MSQVAALSSRLLVLKEEYGMTFQVALTNPNGIVLGSDRTHLYVGLERLNQFQRPLQRQAESKILASDNGTLLCCYAGGAGSQRLAREIRKSCDPRGLSHESWRDRIQEAIRDIAASGPGIQDEVIIVRLDDNSAVLMAVEYQYGPTFTAVTDCCFAGDYSDARFVGHHLMRNDMPLEDMKNLALVCLGYASKNNPTGVGGGFDLVSIAGLGGEIMKDYYDEPDALEIAQRFNNELSVALTGLRSFTKRL